MVTDDTPHEILEQRERVETVRASIASLPAKYRIPLVLREFQGLSYEKISRVTGSTLVATKTYIHRARWKSRHLFTKSESARLGGSRGFA